MPVLAHAGHWLVNLIYFAPVLVIVTWISIQNVRDRRSDRADQHKEEPR